MKLSWPTYSIMRPRQALLDFGLLHPARAEEVRTEGLRLLLQSGSGSVLDQASQDQNLYLAGYWWLMPTGGLLEE